MTHFEDRNTTVIERETKTQVKNERPKLFKVIILNDEYTDFDFVVEMVMRVFHKDMFEAMEIADAVNDKGSAVAGIYPLDVAETKATEGERMAREHEHPLKLITEPE